MITLQIIAAWATIGFIRIMGRWLISMMEDSGHFEFADILDAVFFGEFHG